ncbi:MAG TPA: N-acetylmuramoyl-L-alanine amidase-like domain-containing protein [Longimicrobiaceae bacterium]|nr:N-acetylmuramoyl-L-alanine amidase-like domain-containing protein [Longimicrobiaceae bacterium]
MSLFDTQHPVTRREALRGAIAAAAALVVPAPLRACRLAEPPPREAEPAARPAAADAPAYPVPSPEDRARLEEWVRVLRRERLVAAAEVTLGDAAVRVGELAVGTPYEAFTLEQYLREGGSPSRTEPLTLSLTRFDCVSLVESCLAVARVSRAGGEPTWEAFGREMERMRYRGGVRQGYVSRLHYFSEWISDGARRGLVRELGGELGGRADVRPLRFMTEHRDAYPALADDGVYRAVAAMERGLDGRARHVVPTARIPGVADRIESGDVLAFATSIDGLDVTHSAFAYRDAGGVLRVLHAPLAGGAVEVTRSTLPEYVAAIRRSTGILVARPLRG